MVQNLESPGLSGRVDISATLLANTFFFLLTIATKTVTAWGNDTTLLSSNWSF